MYQRKQKASLIGQAARDEFSVVSSSSLSEALSGGEAQCRIVTRGWFHVDYPNCTSGK